MCGRFSLVDGTKVVIKRFGVKEITAEFETYYSRHSGYNLAPSMMLPIIVSPNNADNDKQLIYARWGLETYRTRSMPQSNARLETVKEKPTFSDAYRNRHCLIPAKSYFEWLRTQKLKQPYRIMLKDESLFAMAGIWENSVAPDQPPTFSVLTTTPNELVAKIHDRMPVILRKEQETMWLKEVGNGVVSLVNSQYPADDMKLYPVTTRMNKVSFESPEAIQPISEPSLGI